jgi:hypothetical protein
MTVLDSPDGQGGSIVLPPPRAIVFDWDNTLVDTWPNIIHTMNATLAAMGQAVWSAAEARRRIARSLRDSFPELFGDRWQEAREIFYAELERSHLAMLTPLPGAAEVLKTFHDSGTPMAVVSNKTGAYLRKEIAHLGLGGAIPVGFRRGRPSPRQARAGCGSGLFGACGSCSGRGYLVCWRQSGGRRSRPRRRLRVDLCAGGRPPWASLRVFAVCGDRRLPRVAVVGGADRQTGNSTLSPMAEGSMPSG